MVDDLASIYTRVSWTQPYIDVPLRSIPPLDKAVIKDLF